MRANPGMPSLRNLRLFDSCMTLGRVIRPGPFESVTRDNILRVMDRYCIEEALVHEFHARTVYPREHGNRRLLEEIPGIPRLHPAWVVEPPVAPGRKAAEVLVREMLESGVKAARLPLRRTPPFPGCGRTSAVFSRSTGFPVFSISEMSPRSEM